MHLHEALAIGWCGMNFLPHMAEPLEGLVQII